MRTQSCLIENPDLKTALIGIGIVRADQSKWLEESRNLDPTLKLLRIKDLVNEALNGRVANLTEKLDTVLAIIG